MPKMLPPNAEFKQVYKGGAKVDEMQGADKNGLQALVTKNK